MLVEFGAFKKRWRGFLDATVDHHLMLQEGDPVAAAILSVLPDSRLLELPFSPTTENMARWLFERAEEVLQEVAPGQPQLRIARMHIQETAVNAAEYEG